MRRRKGQTSLRRKAVGLSQEQLAERLAVDRSTVARWESGETLPQPWLRPKIARVLQVSAEQLDDMLSDPRTVEDETTARFGYVTANPANIDLVTVGVPSRSNRPPLTLCTTRRRQRRCPLTARS